jgi:hypothetical protein
MTQFTQALVQDRHLQCHYEERSDEAISIVQALIRPSPVLWLIGLLLLLSVFRTSASAQVFPVCSWPFESNGRGITNVATPDTHATYWVMPFDSGAWQAMVIRGQYPQARFFNFNTYNSNGTYVDSAVDSTIAPDPGSANPFASPVAASGPRDYTITVGTASASTNVLRVGTSRLVFIVYRVYLPDRGLDSTGGVGLPVVSVVARDGTVRDLRPCPFANAETSLGNLAISLALNGFSDAANFINQILALVKQQPPNTGLCTPGQSEPAAIAFPPATLGVNFFPNPQTTYLETTGLCYQQGSIIVVRGKASVFPNTYLGGSVFQPAFDGAVQLRYWSMCNNDRVVPYPVVGCAADFETNLDPDEFYTYIVSNDPAPPAWLPPYATWLPWGPTAFPKNLILRNINEGGPPIAGAYVPVGAFCSQQVFVQQGWQGCFGAAGIPMQ